MRKSSPATIIASVALFFSLGGAAIASSSTRPTPMQVRRASLAYAKTEASTKPILKCHRSTCQVSQVIDSGNWSGWTLHYDVHVTLRGQWLIAESPLFAGGVRVRAPNPLDGD